MPLPKAPATRGARLDIREAAKNKAKLRPASRRKSRSPEAGEITQLLADTLAPLAETLPAGSMAAATAASASTATAASAAMTAAPANAAPGASAASTAAPGSPGGQTAALLKPAAAPQQPAASAARPQSQIHSQSQSQSRPQPQPQARAAAQPAAPTASRPDNSATPPAGVPAMPAGQRNPPAQPVQPAPAAPAATSQVPPAAQAATAGHSALAERPVAAAARPAPGSPARPAVPAPTANRSALASAQPAPQPQHSQPARLPETGVRKLFVLDTNVLMHDPSALFRFQEHDIFLPMMTLEELDDHKRGMSEVSRHARQVSRSLDALISAPGEHIEDGIPLNRLGNPDATGRLFMQTRVMDAPLPDALPPGKADNRILSVTAALGRLHPERPVVLVSKDINMRIKAHSLGLSAEDYFNDQVTDDLDLLYSGSLALPADFWHTHGEGMASWQEGGQGFYRIRGPLVPSMLLNQFVYLEDGGTPLFAQVRQIEGNQAVLRVVRDYTQARHAIWGITARNREQNFALNLLLDPDIDFVTLLGQAGTGKTLLALTAGLAQTLDQKRFSEIIMTRATVPVGDDIGYLPGTEEEKMQPWMGALEDNLEVLNQGSAGGEWGRAAAADLIRSRIRIKSMSFMRGRTFNNKYLIIDEAQNLTPKQMKTLATRAGNGTKVVCLGNIAQIDTPYLTEASSGLTYVVERFKGWAHGGHLSLQRGERSRLADFAAEVL